MLLNSDAGHDAKDCGAVKKFKECKLAELRLINPQCSHEDRSLVPLFFEKRPGDGDILDIDFFLNEAVGPCGLWQWLVVIVNCISIPSNFIFPTFANTQPQYRCRLEVEVEDYITRHNFSFASVLEKTSPKIKPSTLNSTWSDYLPFGMEHGCYRLVGNWTSIDFFQSLMSNVSDANNVAVEACPYGYVYKFQPHQYQDSVVAEFNTMCQFQWLTPLSTSVYILGMVAGFLTAGWACDRFGRKRTLLLYSLFEFLSGITVSLAPTYTVYALARGCSACATLGKVVAISVLQMELTVAKYRSVMGAVSNIMHSCINRSVVSLLAYYIPSWRWLNAAVLLPSAFSVLYVFLPESPRWLVSQKRYKSAICELRTGYRWNSSLKSNTNRDAVARQYFEAAETSYGSEDITSKLMERNHVCSKTLNSNCCLNLFRPLLDPVLRKTVILSATVIFVDVFCFYGLLFYARIFNLSVYFVSLVNNIATLPGSILFCLFYRFTRHRRLPLQILYVFSFLVLVSGALCDLISDNPVDLLLAVCCSLAIFMLNACMNMLYVYIPELFPSEIRTQGFGLTSSMGRIGGFLCTFVNHSQHQLSNTVPMSIYASALVLGFIVLCFLKDTTGENLPDFIEPSKSLVNQQERETNHVFKDNKM